MRLTSAHQAEEIKKKWQDYTEELYKKDLNDLDNRDSVITHLEPDILECEIKWVLASITTNNDRRADGIPAELFKNPKEWGCKSAAFNMSANLENSAVATVLEKVSFHSNPKKGNSKECSTYHAIELISLARKIMLNMFQAKFQQYMNW